jgi:hypothetical protein|nr:MAG TPA: ParB protein [Caudoviricetes sp.]
MNITDIRTCDLKPYENNPRLNEDAVDLVAASIDEFGFKQPNWRKRAGPIRRFRLHAYGLRTARTEVLHDGV